MRKEFRPGMKVLAGLSMTMCVLMGAVGQRGSPDDPYSLGVDLLGQKGCPIFIGNVISGSPAERAGIHPGDQVLAVNGAPVQDIRQAAKLIHSNGPAPVTLRLKSDGKILEMIVGPEKRSAIFARNGKKIVSGAIVPEDTTQAEVDRMVNFDGRRLVARVFPTHYPADPEIYYPGFEIFVLRTPARAAVGGIEDGPASRAGIHWGDVLISVNGAPVAGKTPSELEQMFSQARPALMRLRIDRMGEIETFDIHLEKAEDVARQNGKRLVGDNVVPAWVSDHYLHCFVNR